MARFVIDAQLPPALDAKLKEKGHHAVHVNDIGLGDAGNERIATEAARRKAILMTKDEDFIARANLGLLPVPVIWIRFDNVTNRILWARLEPILPAILEALAKGEKIIEVV